MTQKDKPIAFQGEMGANSHIACNDIFPDREVLPCTTFEGAFKAVENGSAALAVLPVENTVAGRVADIHRLLPGYNLYIIGEYFMRIRHCLLGLEGASVDGLTHVHSHEMALGQCRHIINELNLEPVVAADTAGSAREIAELNNPTLAAIASPLAAEINGLQIFKENIEDAKHNTTRFLVMAPEPDDAEPNSGDVITSFIFRCRNVPAALYKALGGFATNGVNMTKLESYQVEGSFMATQFYADIEGHPDDEAVRLALDELNYFCSELNILGVYPAAEFRRTM
ncbi:MAG: prephenate dehydratase [PS1 clade bacterium]|uniref:prephenate dehydratase n=1 Tax=PS1 clade bacterium TaxID=2175152 RepID=A0A368DWE2_9PROT|nr:MAG: prephenate dehydratase [PS1 clade bacterium]